MLNFKKCLSTGLCVLMLAGPAGAQNRMTNHKIQPMPVEIADEPAVVIGGVKITIAEAIRQAIEHNYTILAGAYDVAMTDTLYQQYQKKYATFLSASTGAKYSEYPDSLSTFNGYDQKALDVAFSATHSFSTGTTVTAGIQHDYTKTNRPNMVLPTTPPVPLSFGLGKAHQPVIFVNIQQELVKNAFGYNDRRTEQILKNASRMQKEAILYQLSLVVAGVILDYWNVIINQNALDNARLQLQETQYVRDIMARNVELGLVDNYNLNYYNALVAGAKSQMDAAEKSYHDSLRNFLRTINMDEQAVVSSTAVLTDKLLEISEEETLKRAFAKRADYQNALLSLDNAKMDCEMSNNEALPSVIASINASTFSQQETFGKAYGDTLTMTYPSIEGRVSIIYPLDDKGQTANERNAKFKVKQAQLHVDKTRREVKDDVASKIEQIRTMHSLYENAREARIQSELFYTNMLINMHRGRLTAAVVKNGLDALVGSRQRELEALVYYNASLIQFEIAKNELWERYAIDVDKYIPRDIK